MPQIEHRAYVKMEVSIYCATERSAAEEAAKILKLLKEAYPDRLFDNDIEVELIESAAFPEKSGDEVPPSELDDEEGIE